MNSCPWTCDYRRGERWGGGVLIPPNPPGEKPPRRAWGDRPGPFLISVISSISWPLHVHLWLRAPLCTPSPATIKRSHIGVCGSNHAHPRASQLSCFLASADHLTASPPLTFISNLDLVLILDRLPL